MQRPLNELVRVFLEWSAKVHSPGTTIAYRHYLKEFTQRFGDRPIGELKAIHLQECKKTWHVYQAVQRLFNWAVHDAEILRTNPFNKLKRPALGQRKRTIPRGTGAMMLRNANPHFRLFLFAIRETFARPQEIRLAGFENLQSTEGDVDLQKSLCAGTACIVLHEHKTKNTTGDGNKPRVIILSPRVGRLIVRLMRRRTTKDGPIFLTTKDRPWSTNAVRCAFRLLRRRLKMQSDTRGENIVAYSWRHTGATAAAAFGLRDRILAEILGHSSTRTTARYQHLCIDHLQSALKKFWKDRYQHRNPD